MAFPTKKFKLKKNIYFLKNYAFFCSVSIQNIFLVSVLEKVFLSIPLGKPQKFFINGRATPPPSEILMSEEKVFKNWYFSLTARPLKK